MRRWDGKDLNLSVGALSIIATQKALDDAGISRDEVDGVVTCPVGMGDNWSPRPYFPSPYNSEDGLSCLTADWLVKNMGLKNVRFTSHGPSCINTAMSVGAQAVGSGQTHTCIVLRGTGNLEGRYHQMDDNTFSGRLAFTSPCGWQLIPQIAFGFNQYCRKYNTSHAGWPLLF
jgi:3-oxoacyl-[acyl-carrier-protein] synthase III